MTYVLIAFVLYLILVGGVGAGADSNQAGAGTLHAGSDGDLMIDPFDSSKMVLMGQRDICTSLSFDGD